MKFKAAIFDLDGTLLDTLDDLADSANAALARHGFPGHAACAYKLFIGNGVKTLLRRAAPAGTGEDKALLEDLVAEFGREYQARWKAKTKPYPEILETLEKLEQKGVKLAVLSNKPHDFAQLMVNDFFPSTGFAVIFGARPGVPLKPAPDAAFEAAGVLDCPVGEVMLVGDSGMDMRAAHRPVKPDRSPRAPGGHPRRTVACP